MTIMHWAEVVESGEAFHAARFSHGRPVQTLLHGHDFAEVLWIDSGEAVHYLNGNSFPLQAGSLVWIRPQDCHGIETVSDSPLVATNIAFARETMDFLGERYFPEQSWAFWETGDFPMTQQIEPFQRQRLDSWADELARAPRKKFHIERFLLNILNELNPYPQTAWPAETPEWLQYALREIEKPENFVKGVAGFVKLTGYSREHATRSLRQYLNLTPTDLVNRARMAYAAHLLVMSHQSIIEIGLSCGLDNLSHFYTLFRAHYGMTPRAYRGAHRKTF